MNRVSADDIAALKADGDLRRFIADLTAHQPAAQSPMAPALGSAHASPHHRPGAWPSGTRTDIPTCHPDCDCAIKPRPPEGSTT